MPPPPAVRLVTGRRQSGRIPGELGERRRPPVEGDHDGAVLPAQPAQLVLRRLPGGRHPVPHRHAQRAVHEDRPIERRGFPAGQRPAAQHRLGERGGQQQQREAAQEEQGDVPEAPALEACGGARQLEQQERGERDRLPPAAGEMQDDGYRDEKAPQQEERREEVHAGFTLSGGSAKPVAVNVRVFRSVERPERRSGAPVFTPASPAQRAKLQGFLSPYGRDLTKDDATLPGGQGWVVSSRNRAEPSGRHDVVSFVACGRDAGLKTGAPGLCTFSCLARCARGHA